MTEHILVCPYNEGLLVRLKQRTMVIATNDLSQIKRIQKEVNRCNKLYAIKVDAGQTLSDISFQDKWQNIPLAIYAHEFGNFKDILQQLHIIRSLNCRIFLSDQYEFNFIALQILSSLNVSCGLYFTSKNCNWEKLNDLMHYAVYGRVRHAPIEPFGWLTTHYEPTGYTDYSIVYFDNPSKYLHINEHEQIALTGNDLSNKHFIAEGIHSINTIHENKQYQDYLNMRYEIMLQMNECAFCPAFRICLGKYQDLSDKKNTCRKFFIELLEAADFSFSKKSLQWQL